jgi:hypothetical protein
MGCEKMLRYLDYIMKHISVSDDANKEFRQNILLLENEHNAAESLFNLLVEEYEDYEQKYIFSYEEFLSCLYDNYIKLLNIHNPAMLYGSDIGNYNNHELRILLATHDKHLISLFCRVAGLKSEFNILDNVEAVKDKKLINMFLRQFCIIHEAYVDLGGDAYQPCSCLLL